MSDIKISDVPAGETRPEMSQPANPQSAAPSFVPIVAPPSDHHPLNTGLGTEMGDTPKGMIEKINSGFSNMISMLESLGAKPVKAIEQEASDISGKIRGALDAVESWVSANFVSMTEHKAVSDKVANMVPKADFDALKAAHDDLANRFTALGDSIEKMMGLKK